MTSTRDSFLANIGQAVRAGNQAGHTPSLPSRGSAGYQGAGSDLVDRFATALESAGGKCYRAATPERGVAQVAALVDALGGQKIVLGRSDWLDSLRLDQTLTALGKEVWREEATRTLSNRKKDLFVADIGITGVDWLIAESGSVVLASRPGQSRSLSLLPPIHIAVARRSQVLPDLFDWFAAVSPTAVPACFTVITGPSKTGDIELRLVTGVHGPKEIHVVLFD